MDKSIVDCPSSSSSVSIKKSAQQVSCKKQNSTNMPNLPDDVIFQIFLLLPAKVLHDVMRTICRSWRRVIRDPDFIKAHLNRPPITVLCRLGNGRDRTASIVETDQNTGKFNETSRINFVIPKLYMTSGDGLLLTFNDEDRSLYLINPVTKQIVKLPRLPIAIAYSIPYLYSVACSPSTLECKVVYTHYDPEVGTCNIYILTAGIDEEWRVIHKESSMKLQSSYFKSYYAKGIWGFVYWYNSDDSYFIALDVETEVFYKILVPEECRGKSIYNTSSDRFLSFALKHDMAQNGLAKFDFWELVDCKSGEWKKLGRIDWEGKRRKIYEMGFRWIDSISPVTIFNNREVALFNIRDEISVDISIVAYNLRTGIFYRLLANPRLCVNDEFRHVNSLIVLKTYPKILYCKAVKMLEKLEIFWQEHGVYVDELLQTRKLKDVATSLKNQSLSLKTADKHMTSS